MIERPVLTLSQAAKATGKSKGTISNAIKKGRLSANKENGEYQIDAAELSRVYPLNPSKIVQNERCSTPMEPPLNEGLKTENQVLLVRLDAAERQIEALEGDKAFLQSELSKATTLLTDQRQRVERGFWSRLFGN